MQTGKILQGTSIYSYVMKPLDQGSLIESARMEERIFFSPIGILNGAVQMESWYGGSKTFLGFLPSTRPHEAD